jgi:hypothetical protein
MHDASERNERAEPHDDAPHGPRGGNSGRSIPPGVEIDDNYGEDNWSFNPDPASESEKD